MKVQIDRELVKQVANCKDQPRNFLFVPGSKQSVLVIDKKAVGPDDLKSAQKKAEANVAHKGLCFHETDQAGTKTLVFLVKKDVSGLDRMLRKCLKENAGLSTKVEVRLPAQDLLDNDGNLIDVVDKSPDRVVVPKTPTGAQNDVANKAMYKKVLAYLSSKIGDATAVDKDLGARIKAYVERFAAEAERLAGDAVPEGQRDYQAALKVLDKARKAVDESLKKMKRPGRNDPRVNVEFENKLKAAKEKVKAILARAGNSAVAAEAKANYQQAAKHGRLVQFEEGTKILDDMTLPLSRVLTNLGTYTSVYGELMNAQDPACSPTDRGAFDGDLQAALAGTITDAAKAITVLEDRMRQFVTDRKTFLETATNVKALVKEAQQKLPANTARLWQAAYDRTFAEATSVGLGYAYDVMTRAEARLRQALRLAEGNPQPEVTDNPDVDTSSKIDDVLGNKSPEVRKMKFKMNADNLRRALVAIYQQSPNVGKALETSLNNFVKLAETDFDGAEAKLDALNARVADVLKRMQAKLGGQYKQDRMDELEKEQEKSPRGRLGRHRPNAKLPNTTINWSRDIERRQVLTKVALGKQLGEGGFGTIHLLDPMPNVNEEIPPMIVKVPNDPNGVAEFNREAEIYKKVGDHPNIPKCLGMRDVGGQQGLVLERVQGRDFDKVAKDLKDKLARGQITQAEYISTFQYTMTKMLDVLSFMHDKGLTHNDLKYPNVMIDEVTGEPKVIDLGSVKEIGESTSHVDNPLFKAPENVNSGQVSSPQTDGFAAGGVIYNAMNEMVFHFQDQETMNQSFMTPIRATMEEYSKSGDDEGAIKLEDPNNPAVRKVNEKGEVDPKGEHLRNDPSRAGARTNFTDFMNGLMHPDPKKRLTPKQALQHPFLRDRLLSDEQVKEVFTRKGDAPSGQVKAAAGKRGFATNGYAQLVPKIKELMKEVNDLAIDELPLKDVPAAKYRVLYVKAELERLGNYFDTGSKLLAEIVRTAGDKNSEQFFDDNRKLEEMRQILTDVQPVHARAQQLLQALDRKLEGDMQGQVDEAKAGNILSEESLKERKSSLQSRVNNAERNTGSLLEGLNEIGGSLDKATILRRFAGLWNSILDDTEAERRQTVALLRALEADPQAGEAAERCRQLLQALDDCRLGIQEKIRPLAPALDGFFNEVVALQNEAGPLVQEAQTLAGRVDTAKTNAKTLGEKLSEINTRIQKMPKGTTEEIAKFDQARAKFESEATRLREGFAAKVQEVAGLIKSATVKLQEKQMKLGDAPPPRGFPDVNADVTGALTLLGTKAKELAAVSV